jgi:hypothetical protein
VLVLIYQLSMHLEVVSESVVALAQATLRAEGQVGWTSRRTWLRKLLNSMSLEEQHVHYEKAGLTVPLLAEKEAEDLCAWGNSNNTNLTYTVGLCETMINRAKINRIKRSGAVLPVRGPWQDILA